jgi:uncharacterized protein YraI
MRTRSLLVLGAALLALVGVQGAAHAAAVMSPANVRTGPGTSWPVVGSIPAGTDVQVLNCNEGWRHSWCQVRFGDQTGYVNASVLAASGRSNVVVAPVVTTDAANLRTRASLFSSVIEVIPGGETVNVLRCRSGLGNGWCHVAYGGRTGYVRGGLLSRQGSIIPQ